MAKEATSIYIDDSAIRVLAVRGRQPRKWATMSLDPGLVADGVIPVSYTHLTLPTSDLV